MTVNPILVSVLSMVPAYLGSYWLVTRLEMRHHVRAMGRLQYKQKLAEAKREAYRAVVEPAKEQPPSPEAQATLQKMAELEQANGEMLESISRLRSEIDESREGRQPPKGLTTPARYHQDFGGPANVLRRDTPHPDDDPTWRWDNGQWVLRSQEELNKRVEAALKQRRRLSDERTRIAEMRDYYLNLHLDKDDFELSPRKEIEFAALTKQIKICDEALLALDDKIQTYADLANSRRKRDLIANWGGSIIANVDRTGVAEFERAQRQLDDMIVAMSLIPGSDTGH